MDKSYFVERRKHPRVKLKAEVLCYKVDEDNKKGTGILHFYSKDMSVGGIFLQTGIPLEVGSIVYLKFSLPGLPEPVTTRARIIGTQGRVTRISNSGTEKITGMGIEFQFLGYDERKLIDAFIKWKWDEENKKKPGR